MEVCIIYEYPRNFHLSLLFTSNFLHVKIFSCMTCYKLQSSYGVNFTSIILGCACLNCSMQS